MAVAMPQALNAKPLQQSLFEMEGFSRRQIEEHYTLYEAYIKKTNEIRSLLREADLSAANQSYSLYRELKVELSFTLDAVKLHEAYFANLGGAGSQPSDKVRKLMERSFGSMDTCHEDLKATAMAG
ncbi:MAG: superoxide dismutase, partial [Armatimonadota bacterium]|nr:superoxide dismutase [Armatimonadota bacterium]